MPWFLNRKMQNYKISQVILESDKIFGFFEGPEDSLLQWILFMKYSGKRHISWLYLGWSWWKFGLWLPQLY